MNTNTVIKIILIVLWSRPHKPRTFIFIEDLC